MSVDVPQALSVESGESSHQSPQLLQQQHSIHSPLDEIPPMFPQQQQQQQQQLTPINDNIRENSIQHLCIFSIIILKKGLKTQTTSIHMHFLPQFLCFLLKFFQLVTYRNINKQYLIWYSNEFVLVNIKTFYKL